MRRLRAQGKISQSDCEQTIKEIEFQQTIDRLSKTGFITPGEYMEKTGIDPRTGRKWIKPWI